MPSYTYAVGRPYEICHEDLTIHGYGPNGLTNTGFIDRTNIGNARLAGLEKDLRLKGYDYNTLLSVFYISYIIFEIPSNMACKWLGPGWYLPVLTLGFGIITVCFAFVRTLSAACGVRFLLGALEAGVLPGVAYYLSRCKDCNLFSYSD